MRSARSGGGGTNTGGYKWAAAGGGLERGLGRKPGEWEGGWGGLGREIKGSGGLGLEGGDEEVHATDSTAVNIVMAQVIVLQLHN